MDDNNPISTNNSDNSDSSSNATNSTSPYEAMMNSIDSKPTATMRTIKEGFSFKPKKEEKKENR